MSTSGRARARPALGDARDLALTGQEDEDRAALLAKRAERRAGDLRPRSARADRGRDSGSRRERRGPALSISGASPQQRANARAVERRRHDEDAQILAQRRLRVEREARGRDRRRASARGTRRTARPRRLRATGSSRIMRANTPSVTTSMRVRDETRLCSRTRRPIVSPTFSPSVEAMRCAAARAARRLGSSTRMRAALCPCLRREARGERASSCRRRAARRGRPAHAPRAPPAAAAGRPQWAGARGATCAPPSQAGARRTSGATSTSIRAPTRCDDLPQNRDTSAKV